jgi:hypothetical protein
MKLHELLKAFAVKAEDIESVGNDLMIFCAISTAFGQQLDGIGANVDEPRGGRNDDEYRTGIMLRIGINMSSGEPETIINVAKTICNAEMIQYSEISPAKVHLFIKVAVPPSNVYNTIKSILPAGVGLNIDYITDELPFVFAGDDSGLGFGEVNHPSVGGCFAEHLT